MSLQGTGPLIYTHLAPHTPHLAGALHDLVFVSALPFHVASAHHTQGIASVLATQVEITHLCF